ncbi:hypothetical protein BDB01DRAFT_903392 [Pilobolus umbonatus]|nr:hypothetical protein BDB01DRAFT_903392 [Pilobolus umbonatus]
MAIHTTSGNILCITNSKGRQVNLLNEEPKLQLKNKRKYHCNAPGCHKSFTTSGHLARHHRIHTGEKNFHCIYPGCPSKFSRQDNMMQHYRTHLSPRSRLYAYSHQSHSTGMSSIFYRHEYIGPIPTEIDIHPYQPYLTDKQLHGLPYQTRDLSHSPMSKSFGHHPIYEESMNQTSALNTKSKWFNNGYEFSQPAYYLKEIL